MLAKYWQLRKEQLEKFERGPDISRILDKRYIEQEKSFLYGAILLENRVDLHLLVGSPEKGRDYAAIGYEYAEKAKDIKDRSFFPKRLLPSEECEYYWNYYLYRYKWISTQEEDKGILSDIINKLGNLINVEKNKARSQNIRPYILAYCFFSIKLEKFQDAMRNIQYLTERKHAGSKEIIFSPELFLSNILKHLSGRGKKAADAKDIMSAYNRFFSESNKGNPLLMKLPLFHLVELSYAYYRFLDTKRGAIPDPFKVERSLVQKWGERKRSGYFLSEN